MTEVKDGIKIFYAKDRKAWRKWLEKNHSNERNVWLILYNKNSKTPSVTYKEAVEEALCFGWIDSKPNKRDEESRYQFFSKRKPKSIWSKINKENIKKLIKEGLMTPAGMAAVNLAKKNGSWESLDEVENGVIPEDLQQALTKNKKALENFMSFPPSSKKIILYWIQSAKKEETRVKRIKETVELASKNIRANHYRP